jgi:elongation factor P
MDMKTYEQVQLSEDLLSSEKDYLLENMDLTLVYHDGRPISVDLPIAIIAAVVETEPGIKGDTVGTSFKPARIETGATVQVPLFINTGDKIKIDTRTGDYITRV